LAIQDGVSATGANFNAAFLSRTQNSSTVGVVDLNNTADPNSGAQVSNAQRAINETFDAVGMTGIGDASRNNYSSNNYVTNGSSRKTAIGQLDAALASLDAAKLEGPGPTVADRSVVVFDGPTGSLIAESAVTIDVTGNVIIPGDLTVNGTTTSINSTNLDVTDQNITVNVGGNDASSVDAGLTVERTSTFGSLVFNTGSASYWRAGLLGSESDVITDDAAQVLINKDIDGGTASNTNRITVPSDTYANLLTLTRKAGTIVYGTDTQVFYYDNGTSLVAPSGGGEPEVELRTITGGEETAKQLTLASTPATANKTQLMVKSGPHQFYGDDFTVSGAVLSWNGLGLDGILLTGDKVTIMYWV
jgi:hypothetical protein